MIEPSERLTTIGGGIRPLPSRIRGIVALEVNSFKFSLVNAVGFIKNAMGSFVAGCKNRSDVDL